MQRLMICFVVVGALLKPAVANEPKVPQMITPEGWRTELIVLPPGFAPTMKLKGFEDIRFAPGMFDAESDSFFSYTILFWLPGHDKPLDAKTLEQEFLTYYRGLHKAVAGKRLKVDTAKFTASIKPLPTSKPYPWKHQVQQYAGTLNWVEPFRTGKSQTLHLELDSWYCDEGKCRAVFTSVSPKPKKADIWKRMLQIRDAFKCHE